MTTVAVMLESFLLADASKSATLTAARRRWREAAGAGQLGRLLRARRRRRRAPSFPQIDCQGLRAVSGGRPRQRGAHRLPARAAGRGRPAPGRPGRSLQAVLVFCCAAACCRAAAAPARGGPMQLLGLSWAVCSGPTGSHGQQVRMLGCVAMAAGVGRARKGSIPASSSVVRQEEGRLPWSPAHRPRSSCSQAWHRLQGFVGAAAPSSQPPAFGVCPCVPCSQPGGQPTNRSLLWHSEESPAAAAHSCAQRPPAVGRQAPGAAMSSYAPSIMPTRALTDPSLSDDGERLGRRRPGSQAAVAAWLVVGAGRLGSGPPGSPPTRRCPIAAPQQDRWQPLERSGAAAWLPT